MTKILKTQALMVLIFLIALFAGLSFHKVASASEPPCDGALGKAHPNGGGFVASTAQVASRAYVGPQAQVCEQARGYR